MRCEMPKVHAVPTWPSHVSEERLKAQVERNELQSRVESMTKVNKKHMTPDVFELTKNMIDFSAVSKWLELFQDFVHALLGIEVGIKLAIRGRGLGHCISPKC